MIRSLHLVFVFYNQVFVHLWLVMQHVAVLWMIISWLDYVSSENRPESMQQQYWSERFSVSFHLLLPVAGLGFLLFGRKHIFPRLLVQIDRNCISVLCPSLSKREKLIKWACQRLPSKWSSHSSKTLSGGVAELWSDGSLLCTLINTAIPGACPNPHRHWKQPPSHAQAIAYKYLGVVPIFDEEDLAGNLTSNFERTFINYLCEIQQSINKITENTEVERIFCSDYIARGLGLFSGEQHQKTVFYVYPDDFENSEPSKNSVIINIKGPFGTFGHALISNIQNSPAKKPLDGWNISVSNDTKTKSEFMRKFSWFLKHSEEVDEGQKNINIEVTLEKNRAKVSYIPNNYGMHEINLICNGELLKGCPFNVHIFSSETKADDMDIEEKVEGLRHYQKRKIISEMVDLVDEKISFSELEEKYHVDADAEIEKKEPIKSTFNFREVVEEITKNDEVFKNMFNVDIDDETCNNLSGSNKHQSAETEKENNTQYDVTIEQTKTNENSVGDNFVCSVPTNKDMDELDSTEKHDIVDDYSDNDAEFREHNDLSQSCEPNYNVEIQMPVIDEVDEAPDLNENLDTGDEKSEFMSEKKLHIPIEIDSAQKSLEYVSRQTQGLTFKVNINNNNYSLSKPVIIKSDNLTENTHENDLIFTDDIMNIGQQLDEDVEKRGHQIVSEYISSNINKIKIPAEFLENEKKIAANKMNNNAAVRKYFHKTHREPNLRIIECEKTEDLNNNYLSTEHAKLKNHFEILSQKDISEKRVPVLPCQPQKPYLASDTKVTSPICSEHIVHEVKYSQISVAERRKIFAQSSMKCTSSSKNSSFSENESVEVSMNKRNHQIAGLSVLNVLDSLRRSVHTSNDESFSLSSTVSLPNISLESDYPSLNVVKEKKTYWENMSNCSSSRSLFPKNTLKKNKLSEEERNRLIWKKPDIPNTTKTMYVENDIYRSADDILAMTESLNHRHSKHFKSVDGRLDEYEMLTIEERKQMLLKQNYEKEKIARERIMRSKKQNVSPQNMKKNDQFQNYLKPRKVSDQDGVFTSPVMEKIRKFDSASNLSRVEGGSKQIMKLTMDIEKNNSSKVLGSQSIINKENENDTNIVSMKPEPKIRYRSQFNRAIRYFKKLEEKSQGKPKSKISKKSKQFSLDIHSKRDRKRKRGGSLNITERFSIDSLYEDITQNKKGSLKGTPNRTALVEALATFSRIENNYYSFCGNEDDIKYDIFKHLGHIKKRKSLKSIFDVYY
ncbi:unnamed protein product [Phaedon cochleariae]|uniref:Uncharacterized protein n=1 Tax=Phaedon cochleariae TaxID=80249 RepID=A0A9P0DWT2_PHACE|nr:unnamed protein product [Phaedon cochleariae]